MALVGTINPGIDGAAIVPASASAGGDQVSPGTRVHVINGGGSPITVTVVTPGSIRGRAVADTTITVPNGTFPANMRAFDVPTGDFYTNPTSGVVDIQWSATTQVTFWPEGQIAS